jgi:metal-responsive CopG/Arc/MetJ family transcriptional regulator
VETIQVVLETQLLKAADRAARKLKINRSALFREALRAHLARLDSMAKEKQDREGFTRYPDSFDEPAVWDKVADWPDDWREAKSACAASLRRTRSGRS